MFHNKKWISASPGKNKVRILAEGMGITPILAAVLLNKGIETAEEGKRFLYPRPEHLLDPFLMEDMDVSVERIIHALERREKICIYGDYDVDGITSVSFLMRLLCAAGADVIYYIPNRLEEGYGLNVQAIQGIYDAGASLIITVDCGTASYDEVALCNEHGMDVIVTDHHLCQGRLPPALGVVNPRRDDSKYPFKDLAGVGVAYKLGIALERTMESRGNPINKTRNTFLCDSMLDLVALGTIADIVPLVEENRVLVSLGLEQMINSNNIGLRALIKVAGIEGERISTDRVAFGLSPRLNAAGRIADAGKGVELLLEEDWETTLSLAKEIDAQNRERQAIEGRIFVQAVEMAEKDVGDSILILGSEGWHPGAIGIAASRIAEKYVKPVVLFHIDGSEARGSARGVPGLDLYGLLSLCRHYYKSFGGHRQAAGLTVETENLDRLALELKTYAREAMKEIERKSILNAEMDLTGMDLSLQDAKMLELLEPCGFGNPYPLFVKRHIKLETVKRVGKGKNHLKFVTAEEGKRFNSIAFRWGRPHWPLRSQWSDIIFSPRVNSWLGKEELQLIVEDIKDISMEKTFINRWYTSLMTLEDRCAMPLEAVSGPHNLGIGLEAQRVNCGQSEIRDLFLSSTGNILLLNGYIKTLNVLSMLSLYTDTEICFGRLKGYSRDKNYVIVHPLSFEGVERCKGKLYFYDRCLLPDQLRTIAEIENIYPVVLVDKSYQGLWGDLLEILPDREETAVVYHFIKRKNDLNFDEVVRVTAKRGIASIKTFLAVEGLKSVDLIGEKDGGLFLKPVPKDRIRLQDFPVFNTIRNIAESAKVCPEIVIKDISNI